MRVVVGGGAAPGFDRVLQKLYLSECKGLTGLPEGLSALTALQTLDLSGWLTGLPQGLSALTALH